MHHSACLINRCEYLLGGLTNIRQLNVRPFPHFGFCKGQATSLPVKREHQYHDFFNQEVFSSLFNANKM